VGESPAKRKLSSDTADEQVETCLSSRSIGDDFSSAYAQEDCGSIEAITPFHLIGNLISVPKEVRQIHLRVDVLRS